VLDHSQDYCEYREYVDSLPNKILLVKMFTIITINWYVQPHNKKRYNNNVQTHPIKGEPT